MRKPQDLLNGDDPANAEPRLTRSAQHAERVHRNDHDSSTAAVLAASAVDAELLLHASTVMPFNLPGTLVPFHLLINPRLIIPSLIVKDIRQLDFVELRRAGYRGAVFDKDNCLTLPHKDRLVPELKDAWKECREAFGERNVVVVSNSAGTYLDPGLIQAESVSYHLGVPVLRHKVFKPSYSSISAVRGYFSSLAEPVHDHQLIVVGDRLFTDIALANRMSRRLPKPKPVLDTPSNLEKADTEKSSLNSQTAEQKPIQGPTRTGPLSVWTSGVWERENMFMRALEKGLMTGIQKYIAPDNGIQHMDELERFVKKPPPIEATPSSSALMRRFWTTVRRA